MGQTVLSLENIDPKLLDNETEVGVDPLDAKSRTISPYELDRLTTSDPH